MKSGKIGKYGVGYIIVDCVLLIGTIIDISTGKVTASELCMLIILSLLLTIPVVAWIKRRKGHSQKYTDGNIHLRSYLPNLRISSVSGSTTHFSAQSSSGTTVVSYTYDAWGRHLTTTGSMASTLGTHNPLRYRGYVYDTETGLYYLQSRYYNPTIGRFLNADVFVSTGQGLLGNNMFAYCRNNPVIRKDAFGTDDVRVRDASEDDNPLNDYIGIGGAGGAVASIAACAFTAGAIILNEAQKKKPVNLPSHKK